MGATPEVLVKRQIKKILKDARVYFAMPIGSGYGNAGVPDFLVCHHGRFIGIEAKAGKGKTTALQDKNLNDIRESGGVAIVIYEHNIDELKELLNATHT